MSKRSKITDFNNSSFGESSNLSNSNGQRMSDQIVSDLIFQAKIKLEKQPIAEHVISHMQTFIMIRKSAIQSNPALQKSFAAMSVLRSTPGGSIFQAFQQEYHSKEFVFFQQYPLKQHCFSISNLYPTTNYSPTLTHLTSYLSLTVIKSEALIRITRSLIKQVLLAHEQGITLDYLTPDRLTFNVTNFHVELFNPIQKAFYAIGSTQEPKEDKLAVVACILHATRIRSDSFQSFLKFNLVDSFFEMNFSGSFSQELVFFLIYLWKATKSILNYTLPEIHALSTFLLKSNTKNVNANNRYHKKKSNTNSDQIIFKRNNNNNIDENNEIIGSIFQLKEEEEYEENEQNNKVAFIRPRKQRRIVEMKLSKQNECYWKKREVEICLKASEDLTGEDWRDFGWIQFNLYGLISDPLESFEQALLFDPSDVVSLSYAGIVHATCRQFEKAKLKFMKALEINAFCPHALFHLGQFALEIDNNPITAASYFNRLALAPSRQDRRILEIDLKECSQYAIRVAELYWKYEFASYQRFDAAVYWTFYAAISHASCAKTLSQVAQYLFAAEKYSLAVYFCTKAMQIDQTLKEIYFILARISHERFDIRRSEKFFLRAANLNHNKSYPYLVDLYERFDDLEAMEMYFFKCISHKSEALNSHPEIFSAQHTYFLYK